VWTLYGAFLGLAFLYAADRTGQREIYQLGRAFIFISLAAFFLLGSIFEFLIFDGFIRRFLLAAVLICAGIWMISQDRDNTKSKPKAKRIPDDEALNELTYFVNSQTIPNDGEINPDHPRST